MEIIILSITPIFLIILGIVIRTGKANFLIAGYNTASKEEKEKINEKELAKSTGNLLLILGGIQFILLICRLLSLGDFKFLLVCVNILFIFVTIGGVIYMNTAKKFKR
ncbi:hypothetical protein HMPREF1092_03078 [Clostridium thermobutyricum]|uniref:DUF3784 domain-containing protein n=1 Tax=Clostridium thermobutyricum TaxID=29372 RepID=N9XWE6_9CLOT|nr:DUF3784 domain-containing protein [Clostridium thermobutyricum]ENY99941.1 hypothetical protein HMPREF1092_03078 [Clostridium thermobutyricum]